MNNSVTQIDVGLVSGIPLSFQCLMIFIFYMSFKFDSAFFFSISSWSVPRTNQLAHIVASSTVGVHWLCWPLMHAQIYSVWWGRSMQNSYIITLCFELLWITRREKKQHPNHFLMSVNSFFSIVWITPSLNTIK